MVRHLLLLGAHVGVRDDGIGDLLGRAPGDDSGIDAMYVGERCSIVTWPADLASDGTSVTAVAPLPMTTTRLPA